MLRRRKRMIPRRRKKRKIQLRTRKLRMLRTRRRRMSKKLPKIPREQNEEWIALINIVRQK